MCLYVAHVTIRVAERYPLGAPLKSKMAQIQSRSAYIRPRNVTEELGRNSSMFLLTGGWEAYVARFFSIGGNALGFPRKSRMATYPHQLCAATRHS